MKRFIKILASFFFVMPVLQAWGEENSPIRVVATTPDIADLAKQIGGDAIEVRSLAKGGEDPHQVPMKPSFVSLLNRADVLVIQGLGLEHAFLPGLLEAARNSKILPGAVGYIDCSQGVRVLDVPTTLSRAEGEQHPDGNPHINLNPENAMVMATNIASRLSGLYPQKSPLFQSNLQRAVASLQDAIREWRVRGSRLKGVRFVSYHQDVSYLADFFGMEQVGTLELKPGIPPTPSHVEEIIKLMRLKKVTLLVREIHYPTQLSESVAEATGARIADIAVMSGSGDNDTSYRGLVESNLQSLLKAVDGTSP